MSSDFQNALAAMVRRAYAGNEVDPYASERRLRRADVIWGVWKDDGGTLHARVILGRELDAHGLVHVAFLVQDEDQVVQEQATMGDHPIETDDKEVLQAPEPAVPGHMAGLLIHAFGG